MSKRYQVDSHSYVHRKIAGEDVLISIGQNVASYNGFVEINDSGAYLFDILKNPGTPEELADYLCREYDVSKNEALKDVSEFLKLMEEHQMVNVYES